MRVEEVEQATAAEHVANGEVTSRSYMTDYLNGTEQHNQFFFFSLKKHGDMNVMC
jgi:hypothetical protein